jgi:hypothetical protein
VLNSERIQGSYVGSVFGFRGKLIRKVARVILNVVADDDALDVGLAPEPDPLSRMNAFTAGVIRGLALTAFGLTCLLGRPGKSFLRPVSIGRDAFVPAFTIVFNNICIFNAWLTRYLFLFQCAYVWRFACLGSISLSEFKICRLQEARIRFCSIMVRAHVYGHFLGNVDNHAFSNYSVTLCSAVFGLSPSPSSCIVSFTCSARRRASRYIIYS